MIDISKISNFSDEELDQLIEQLEAKLETFGEKISSNRELTPDELDELCDLLKAYKVAKDEARNRMILSIKSRPKKLI